ncbi:MAG: hypothetical protein FJ279_36455, partial [Planctomycetes bacterium]|nr:hypothetical protein [Planctomycetota bacterium]
MKTATPSVQPIERTFANPPGTYRPVPWWTWAGDMNEQEMDRQLKEMKQKGINEFFIFPIYGLETPYLSEAWWRAVEFTLRRCERLGMKVWIYDDYNWPSGVCGGYLLRDMPWVRNWGMNYVAREVAPGAEVALDYLGELVEAKVVSADGQAASPP